MERLRLIYEQMEGAKRLIQSGTLPHLRMALILLDNAVELIMYRELREAFGQDDFYKRMRTNVVVANPPDHWTPKYTEDERLAAEKEFVPMVRILSFRLKMISDQQAVVLRVCHEMRRDAFHRGEMNAGILRPVSFLLFLTVAELAKAFPVHSYSVTATPTPENAEFLRRFDVSADELGVERGKEKIYSRLVEGISADGLAKVLSNDLEQRIDLTVEGLSYLNDGSTSRAQIDHNLRYGQFWPERGAEIAKLADQQKRLPADDLSKAYQEWTQNPGPRFTLDKLDRWRRQATAIGTAKNSANALARYRGIERLFAPLEEEISEAVSEYDDHINMLVHDRYPRRA